MDNIIANMDKKIKILFLGLIGLSVVCVLFLVSVMASKQALLQEYVSTRERLTKENEALAQRANMALEDKRRSTDRLDAIQKDLDRVSKEKDEIQKKYEVLVREREGLIERLKRRPTVEETKIAPTPQVEDAYWGNILKEKTGLEIQVSNLRNELENFKVAVDEAKRDKLAMELEIKNLSRDKQDLENRIAYNDKIADNLSAELVIEKNDKRLLREELRTLKNEHAALLRQLKTLNNQRASLEARVKETEQGKVALESKVKDMDQMLEYKLSEVMGVKKDLQQLQEAGELVKSSIELPPIIVRSGGAVSPTTKTGKVLAVNKENNFIVIDLGEADGLKPGVNFEVYRQNTKIAQVEVIQMRKNVSACDIKQASMHITVGDEVR